MGKIIYECKGKAAEYSKYAFSAFVGCSNACTYCYLKRGRFKAIMGGDKPTLKKCFKNEVHALEVFKKELLQNLQQLREHGLFFSFCTDPYLHETARLTIDALRICSSIKYDIPVKILTKRAEIMEIINHKDFEYPYNRHIAIGFTLTGHDELEPNASTNAERIEAMRKLHEAGFKVWAYIEPMIDFETSRIMIRKCIERNNDCCDLFKIGLMSGKAYDSRKVRLFVDLVLINCEISHAKVYFKDSLLSAAGIRREDLPYNCVTRDYNIFKDR
jgi:DNA repair photolyase